MDFLLYFLFLFNLFKELIEYALLLDKKIIFDLSLLHFNRILSVPSRFVLKTLIASLEDFLDASTDGSAQQSIMKSNFGNNLIFFLSEISNLKFLIFFNSNLFYLFLNLFLTSYLKRKL